MYPTLTSAALLGLSAIASARPPGTLSASNTGREVAFSFPLSNGFPNITNPSEALTQIEMEAQGTIPNAPPPPQPASDSLTSLGFIAFNELFEVAFFTELISNITNNVAGYQDIPNKASVLKTLQIIQAQEELHELNANLAFQHFTNEVIQPCKYVFPVNSFKEAIALASTFTDVVLGTLPDIQTVFADNDDNGLIRGVGSVIGQEGEQNGFFRTLLDKAPSALPFLTASARDFAFSAINQAFVVPGSCPSLHLLEPALQIFGVLNVLNPPTAPINQEVKFSLQTQTSTSYQTLAKHGLYLTYVNQQNVPFSVPLTAESFTGNALDFTASFPGADHEMNGLTIAAVTKTNGPFSSVDAVAADTLFGPGLIEVH